MLARQIVPLLFAVGCTVRAAAPAPAPVDVEPDAAPAAIPEPAPGVPDAAPDAPPPRTEAARAADAARPPAADAFVVTDAGALGDVLPPGPVAACAGGQHAVCADFEAGKLDAPFTGRAPPRVDDTRAAHGKYALHFPDLTGTAAQRVVATQLGAISNVLYGRMYLFITPGAPKQHGALVTAYDQAGNWYELGFQFGAYHGNYHPPGGERWMNSKFVIPPGRWVCVEWLFDGATPAVTKIWSDGEEVQYSQVATGPALIRVTRFTRVEVGFIPFHPTAPAMEMWMDDVALDTTRIGCR